jgi:hypothetical protein
MPGGVLLGHRARSSLAEPARPEIAGLWSDSSAQVCGRQ